MCAIAMARQYIEKTRLEKLLKKEVVKLKKFLLIFLLAFSMFSITGCGNDEQPDDGEDVEDVEEEDEIGDGEVDDE